MRRAAHFAKISFFVVFMFLITAGFQNCGKVNFSQGTPSILSSSPAVTGVGGNTGGTDTIPPIPGSTPSDGSPGAGSGGDGGNSPGGGVGIASYAGGGNIIVLDPQSANSMTLSGVANVSANQIAINSVSPQALTLSGASNVSAAQVLITGNYETSGVAQVQVAQTGVAPTADPLASLAAPSESGLTVYPGLNVSGIQTATMNPGVYSDVVSISGVAVVTMNPGIYIFKNGLSLSGSTSLKGSGVLLYIEGGSISLSGTSHSSLSPASSGTYSGVTVFQARDNTMLASLSGASDWMLKGIVYIPNAPVDFSGVANLPQPVSLIVWELNLNGAAFVFKHQ